jgi:hypothetical protein
MPISYDQRDTLLRERDRVLGLMTLPVSISEMNNHILSGCKSRLERDNILTVPSRNGIVRIYHLTTSPDSLASSEKNASGSTGMAKPGKSIDETPPEPVKKE